VEKFYSTERPTNYIESSLRTAIDIHAKEPPGDVLIFMTGKVSFFLEHAGELDIIVLIERGVLKRPKHPPTKPTTT